VSFYPCILEDVTDLPKLNLLEKLADKVITGAKSLFQIPKERLALAGVMACIL
jgi:hypothetical protein